MSFTIWVLFGHRAANSSWLQWRPKPQAFTLGSYFCNVWWLWRHIPTHQSGRHTVDIQLCQQEPAIGKQWEQMRGLNSGCGWQIQKTFQWVAREGHPDLGKYLLCWHNSFSTKYSSLWLQISMGKEFSLSDTSAQFFCLSPSSFYTLPLSSNDFTIFQPSSSAEVAYELHLQSLGPFLCILLLTFCVASALRQYALPC